jgi:hypothetical protein
MPLIEEELRSRWKTEEGQKCLREVLKGIKAGSKEWQKTLVSLPGVEEVENGKDLRYVNLNDINLSGANISYTNLSYSNLSYSNLHGADLSRANLSQSYLRWANLRYTNLSGTDLSGAYLGYTDLSGADLSEADLSRTNLSRSNLSGAVFSRVNLSNAELGYTLFVNINLSNVQGLNICKHLGPSTIGIDTIYNSRGEIPHQFLRDAGIPENFIDNMSASVEAMEPSQFYSCFISYSSKDEEFAKRLHADLQENNVRCWFSPEHMIPGDIFRERIDRSIFEHDKLLLVLSENSIDSKWVQKEVETAFEKEERHNCTVLFPIRLDDAVMKADVGWAADIRRARHIGDFRDWQNQGSYQKAFNRLIKDLKAEMQS